MGAGDLFTAALILAATAHLLYRSLFRRGGCHGCSGGGCAKRPPPESTLVRLGSPGPREGGRPGSSRSGA